MTHQSITRAAPRQGRSARMMAPLALIAAASIVVALAAPAPATPPKQTATTHVPAIRPMCSGPPAAPIVTITNISRDGADLTWSTAEGATGYSYALSFRTASGWGPGTGWIRVESPTVVRVQREGATAFAYSVSARNSCGVTYAEGSNVIGNPGPTKTIELRGRPSPPSAVTATYSGGLLNVSWVPPTDNGGSALTGYTVTASPGGQVCGTASTTCSATLSLPPGTQVTFTAMATNAAGTSDPSAPSNTITLLGAPSPPLDVQVAKFTTTSATVSWNASESGGGAAVTAYVVTASPGGRSCQSASLSCRVTGLKPGTTYTFKVTASNGTLVSEPTKSQATRLPRPQVQQPQPKPKPTQQLT